jgi:[ribosomal protein S5]-alanine N-acetyltransferase
MQSARLAYLPLSAAGFRALMASEAEFERCLSVPPAEGLRVFVVSDEVSPEFLAKLGTSSEADPWNYGFVLVPEVLLSAGRREAIGLASFKGPPDGEGRVEIAYGIVPGYQNRGFATEAAAALVDFAKADPRVRLIRAHTMPTNNASTKVLERNGFKLQGPVIDPEDGEVWRWDLPVSSPTA